MSNCKHNIKSVGRAKKFFIAIVSAFITLALGVTCALCFGNSARQTVVKDSATGGAVTSATNLEGDQSSMAVGGVIDYTYNNNKVYSVRLPAGSYRFEVWGAQGGNGYRDGTLGAGSAGGYSVGTATIATATTFYIVVGGQGGTGRLGTYGTSAYGAGGYNGGGNSGCEMNSDANDGGGGGGGATHIALVSGVLRNLSSTANRNNVVIVAGGGGGASYTRNSSYGQGGGTSGGTGYGGSRAAGGGTQTGGGIGGTTAESGATHGTAGGFGYGGVGGNGTTGGGGGGGGWYGGGAGGAGGQGGSGGGGSGYIGTLSTAKIKLTDASMRNGQRNGNGYARITSLNTPPKAASSVPSMGTGKRGDVSLSINASTVATDTSGQSLYFTQNVATNLDTRPADNHHLYLNSACTLEATKYLDWSWTNSNNCTTLTVKKIKLYPRSGVDGCTSNGRLTLYARVRDNYGSATTRGVSVVPFYLYVSEPAATLRGSTTTTASISDNKALIGTTSSSQNSTSGLYNPNGNRYTVTVKQPLKIKESVTIQASELLQGLYTKDKVVIALNSVASITGSARKFSIREYDNRTNKETAYNSSKALIANTFNQLTFVCEKPDTSYQVFTVTLYVVETDTAYTNPVTQNVVPGISAVTLDIVFKIDNTRPVLKDTSSNAPVVTLNALTTTPIDLNDYYKDADTTTISSSTHQIKGVKVATSEYIQLDKYGNIVSTANATGGKSYFNLFGSTAPSKDMMSNSMSDGMLSGNDNLTGFDAGLISNSASYTAYVQYSYSNATLNLTGLRATYDMYKSGRNNYRLATGGSVTGGPSINNASGLGLNAGHFYILINLQDKSDVSDTGIWLPLGIIVNNTAPTDISKERGGAGASVMPNANGDPNDIFRFSPMGVTINNVTHPIGRYYDSVRQRFVSDELKALASDADNFYTADMLNGLNGNGVLNELVTVKSTVGEVQESVSYNKDGEYFTVSELKLYIPLTYFGKRVKAGATIERVDYNNDGNDIECVVIKGLTVTLNSWTHNRNLYAKVTLNDSSSPNATVNVNIAVNVNNTTPEVIDQASDVALIKYSTDGKTVESEYKKEGETAVVTYRIPMHTTAIITPYDFITDGNMTNSGVIYPTDGFTLNGLSGYFGDGVLSVGDSRRASETRSEIKKLATDQNEYSGGADFGSTTYIGQLKSTLKSINGKRTFTNDLAKDNRFGSTVESNKTTGIDRLYFERTSDSSNLDGYVYDPYVNNANSFSAPSVIGVPSFVSYSFGHTVRFKNDGNVYDTANTFNIDYIVVTANSRTQVGAPAEINLKVRDRMGAASSGENGIKTVKILIEVINSAPRVQHPDKIYTLTTSPIGDASYSIDDAGSTISVKPSTFVISAAKYSTDDDLVKNFLTDNENDAVSFYTGGTPNYWVLDEAGASEDADHRAYSQYYLNVTLTSDTLTITALNSTQSIKRLYVVFYATDGRSSDGVELDRSRCSIQVEVENAKMQYNYGGVNGFTRAEYGTNNYLNLWSVESLNLQDVVKARYFASGSKAMSVLMDSDVMNTDVASLGQIKILSTDTDLLQGAVLSPVSNPNENEDSRRGYYNADPTGSPAIDYKSAVPYISPVQANGVAVLLDIQKPTTSDATVSKYVTSYDILYFVNNTVYSASKLRSADDTTVADHWEWFFDNDGRWKVTDWAIVIVPKTYSVSDEFIRLNVMLRDETRFGGSSAGEETSFSGGNATSVDGFRYMEYQMFINGIGIVPYTYYDQFDGYYVVADAQNSDTKYISTYDGVTDSIYDADKNPLYLNGDQISTSSGTLQLKTRLQDTEDNTYAGVHSGEIFQSGKNYTYDVRVKDSGTGQITVKNDVKEKAFKYSDTIKISEDKSVYTYIPMSYLALSKSLVDVVGDDGRVNYFDEDYVAYDITGGYDRKTAYKRAITISDGTTTWGNGSDNPLDANPYVKFTSFDAYDSGTATGLKDINSLDYKAYESALKGDYFNHCLAVPTVDDQGKALKYLTSQATTTVQNVNAPNLVGNEGRMMYLADQDSKIQENLFGFGIAKNQTRASAANLTITIAVAQCRYSANGTETTYNSANKDSQTAKVTFKLEIGNSPITLNRTSVVEYDSKSGYYTSVELLTGDKAKTIGLSRTTAVGADVTVQFIDDDATVENDRIVESKSDSAYFYAPSMRRLGAWSTSGDAAYTRVKTHTVSGSDVLFSNTASNENAQQSMRNYFGKRNDNNFVFNPVSAANINDVNSSFLPNNGIYGSNMNGSGDEGYSSYFGTTVSTDGTMLSITPYARTEINALMLEGKNVTQYYNERGLEYDSSKSMGYYPLKVLIYDSHGDGFMSGSYVALEIRVYIKSSAPTLSDSLTDEESTAAGYKKGDKRIEVPLPVESTYRFSVADVINSGDILTTSDNELFWQSDYEALKASATSKNDNFRLETGSFLKSPFGDANYGWSATGGSNENLRGGTAKLSDGNIAVESQPDVIMSMAYNSDAGKLGPNSIPASNVISITVNRRMTYDSRQYKNFVFELVFTDSNNNPTNKLRIYVEVTNKAPTIRQNAVELSSEIKMRVGDSFTVVTTPYDLFTGENDGNSVSAQASTSYDTYIRHPSSLIDRNLCRVNGDSGFNTATKYSELTESAIDSNPNYMLHNYNDKDSKTQHLGYLAIAEDDTPWALRIENVSYYDNSCFEVASERDRTYMEGATSGRLYCIDAIIVAYKVCTRMPITVTVVDEDGARATITIYVTVVSSKPHAIMNSDAPLRTRSEALLATYTTGDDGSDKEVEGVYETYMTANTDAFDKKRTNVTVYDENKDATRQIANVYGLLELDVNKIAYDPDSNDNLSIALYTEGSNYHIFTMNGMNMKKTGNVYSNDMFRITVASDYKSFTVECLTYNPYSDWDELSFYIRDCGNNVFDNAIPITIRISTLYSAITNAHQSSTGNAVSGELNDRGVVDTIYVKPYDDYIGTSADVKDLPSEEKNNIVGVQSTYQFLNYSGMPTSVDQDVVAGRGINDPDVVNSRYNLNYDVNVYAFLSDSETRGDYKPLPLNRRNNSSAAVTVSDFLDLSNSNLREHYLYLKDDADVSNYLIGGIYAGGASIVNINNPLVMFLQQYFEFEIGADGVSLAFRPVTSNLDLDIMFYVEVRKTLDSGRMIRPNNAVIKSGTLFNVKVKDSAPVANTESSVLGFTGKINDSHIFPIFDEKNPYLSMFTDTDMGDVVSVNAKIDYEKALEKADCAWQADTGIKRAIEIEVNNESTTQNNIPAHSLKITIQRRIDKLDGEKYCEEVTLPVLIEGEDKDGRKATVELSVTIQNSDFDMSADKLERESNNFDGNGVGYSMSVDEDSDKSYILDAYIAPDSGALDIDLVSGGWLDDPDYTDMSRDTDSFRLVKPEAGENSDKYLVDGTLSVYADDGTDKIAELSPVFGSGRDGKTDKIHFVGFKISAVSYKRNITGIAYMRILDRSGNEAEASAGITIEVRITVLNAAPLVKTDKLKTQHTVVGSDSKAPDAIAVNIDDYVTDRNGDTVTVYSVVPYLPDEIHSTDSINVGGNLIEISIAENGRSFRILPRKGFYGTQTLQVIVADGDLSSDIDARTTSFEITLTVVYDFTQITNLNNVSAIRSLPKKVTTDMLFPDIEDKYDEKFFDDDEGTQTSADEVKTFNAGKDYVIIDLTPNGANTTVSRDADNDWQFVCTRETDALTFNVKFVRKMDYDAVNGTVVEGAQTFDKTFTAVIGKNSAPVLLENFKRDTGYTFHSGDRDYGLDSNGTVTLTPTMLFADADIALGDRLLFDEKVIEVVSPTMCSVRVSDDKTLLYLTFNYRGETELTVGVKDRTGETVKVTFTIKNIDRPEPSFFTTIKISYETHPFIWLGVGIGLLVLIIFIILLIILLKRRKRKREELEAILVSEMELEEQMMRLAGGAGAAPYQSYGYLPPTMPVQNDPNLMLGTGANETPNDPAIGLNAGQGQSADNGNNGVSSDSDM